MSGLSWSERNSFLNEDNRHDENGKPNTTHGIKLQLAANLEHPTYFSEEKQELNLLYASLNNGNNSAEQEKLLKNRIECLEKEIKDDLADLAKLWGISDLTTAKRHATEAWNHYQQTQIYKIYPTPEKERISNYNSAAAKYAEDKNIITYRWMYKSGGGSAYLYKAVGAINDMITERVEKQGVDPGDLSVKVFVTLKSPKSFEGFFADRRFIQSELNRFLCFKTLVGKGIECYFAGQVKADLLNEDTKEFYTLEESEERYAKYLAARREKK